MVKIFIEDFSTIKRAELEIKALTVIIGPQSSGKSVIAKLIYFFKTAVLEFQDGLVEGRTLNNVKTALVKRFRKIFPQYLWSDKVFNICFKTDAYELSIYNTPKKSLKKINLKLSNVIREAYGKTRETVNKERKTVEESRSLITINIDKARKEFGKFYTGHDYYQSFYIPSGRSFFINVEKNLFAVMENTSLDLMLSEFGRIYQNMKNRVERLSNEVGKPRKGTSEDELKLFGEIVDEILSGEIFFKSGKEFIRNKDKQLLEAIHASSGQQELFPILLTLYAADKFNDYFYLLIEEPESHLFPIAQMRVIQLLLLKIHFYQHRMNFFVTTHSPYVLTALNNAILASKIHRSIWESKVLPKVKQEDYTKKLFGIVNNGFLIDEHEIAAYQIVDGVVESILDNDTGLISADFLDKVSEIAAADFEKLLELEDALAN